MIADGVAAVTSKNAKLDDPPPGPGFTTVTMPVPAGARLEAGTVAVKLSPLPKVVGRACPFHCTTEPATNPTPPTVKGSPCLPAFALLRSPTRPVNPTRFEDHSTTCSST